MLRKASVKYSVEVLATCYCILTVGYIPVSVPDKNNNKVSAYF